MRLEDLVETVSLAEHWRCSLLGKFAMAKLDECSDDACCIKQYVDLVKKGMSSASIEMHIAERLKSFVFMPMFCELPVVVQSRLLVLAKQPLLATDVVRLCARSAAVHGEEALILLLSISIELASSEAMDELSNAISFMQKSLVTDCIKLVANLNDRHLVATKKLGDKIPELKDEAQRYVELLTEAVDGRPDGARLEIAQMRLSGRYLDQNVGEAVKQLLILGKSGNPTAQVRLAECYEKGSGVTKDLNEAMKYYRLAAEKGDKDVLFILADKMTAGQITISRKDSIACLRRAATAGHVAAQFIIGDLFESGKEPELGKNLDLAVAHFKRAGLQGHRQAAGQCAALLAQSGQGEEKTTQEFKRIAEAPSLADAYFVIGGMYLNGSGIEADLALAADYYRKSADLNCGDAAAVYGEMLQKGQGVQKHVTHAVKYYQIAANNGNAEGAYRLGEMYETGVGVQCNLSEAADNYRKAANSNHANACYRLAIMIDDGRVPANNARDEFELLTRAADKGHADAAYSWKEEITG